MVMEAEAPKKPSRREYWVAIGLSLFAALAFYFSTNPTLRNLDYTAEIASALLRGDLGLREKPPEWLNEMIPYGNKYYSAFPLGAVLSMLPVALLQKASLIQNSQKHSDLSTPASSPNHSRVGFCWRCFQFLERGPGAISEWAAPGKSLSVWRYWEKPQLCISRWCAPRLLSPGHSSPLRLETGPSS